MKKGKQARNMKEHYEHDMSCAKTGGRKYAGDFDNPEVMKRKQEKLAEYVKSHKPRGQ